MADSDEKGQIPIVLVCRTRGDGMQKLFSKSSQRSLDGKGRLMLPSAYRQALEAQGVKSFWLTSLYGRLVAYLPEDWEHFVEELQSVSTPSMQLVRFNAKVIGLAEELEWTPQGRVRIPQPLLRDAGINLEAGKKSEVMVIGMFSRFEIWDFDRFNAIDTTDVSAELAEKGISLGL